MSNDWTVACITCGEDLGVGWNHGDDRARELIANREVLANIAVAKAALKGYTSEVRTESYGDLFEVEFFERHRGHDIRAKDEYGAVDGRCNEWGTKCPCGRSHPCRRAKNHEGEHSIREDMVDR